jgi:hypothetical protein
VKFVQAPREAVEAWWRRGKVVNGRAIEAVILAKLQELEGML